jgi:hypothetical protein
VLHSVFPDLEESGMISPQERAVETKHCQWLCGLYFRTGALSRPFGFAWAACAKPLGMPARPSLCTKGGRAGLGGLDVLDPGGLEHRCFFACSFCLPSKDQYSNVRCEIMHCKAAIIAWGKKEGENSKTKEKGRRRKTSSAPAASPLRLSISSASKTHSNRQESTAVHHEEARERSERST